MRDLRKMFTIAILIRCGPGSSDNIIKHEKAAKGSGKGDIGPYLLADDVTVCEEHPKKNYLKIKKQVSPKVGR